MFAAIDPITPFATTNSVDNSSVLVIPDAIYNDFSRWHSAQSCDATSIGA